MMCIMCTKQKAGRALNQIRPLIAAKPANRVCSNHFHTPRQIHSTVSEKKTQLLARNATRVTFWSDRSKADSVSSGKCFSGRWRAETLKGPISAFRSSRSCSPWFLSERARHLLPCQKHHLIHRQ